MESTTVIVEFGTAASTKTINNSEQLKLKTSSDSDEVDERSSDKKCKNLEESWAITSENRNGIKKSNDGRCNLFQIKNSMSAFWQIGKFNNFLTLRIRKKPNHRDI